MTVLLEYWLLVTFLQDLIDWEIDCAMVPGAIVRLGRRDMEPELAAMRYTVVDKYGPVIVLRFPDGNTLRLNYNMMRDQMDLMPA